MKYYLYILKSQKTDKYYTGISNNPERRLEFHNSLGKGFKARYRLSKIGSIGSQIFYTLEYSDEIGIFIRFPNQPNTYSFPLFLLLNTV